jgi:hypothetical protein
MSAPSLRLLSQTSSLLRADPSLRRTSVLSRLRASCPPCGSPLASPRQVPTFRTVASLPAHAASMPATIEAEHRLLLDFVPDPPKQSGFRWQLRFDFDTSSAVHFVRLLGRHLPSLTLDSSTDAHHASCHPRAARGGLEPGPATRLRGAFPHQLGSMLSQGHCLVSASWHTQAVELGDEERVGATSTKHL